VQVAHAVAVERQLVFTDFRHRCRHIPPPHAWGNATSGTSIGVAGFEPANLCVPNAAL
jgi:hypothetical protein